MKRILMVVGIVAVVMGALVNLNRIGRRQVGSRDSAAELRREVVLLEGKLAVVEKRLAALEDNKPERGTASKEWLFLGRNDNGLIRRFDGGISGEFVDPNRPPKIAGEGVINGWKYYVVPLSGQ